MSPRLSVTYRIQTQKPLLILNRLPKEAGPANPSPFIPSSRGQARPSSPWAWSSTPVPTSSTIPEAGSRTGETLLAAASVVRSALGVSPERLGGGPDDPGRKIRGDRDRGDPPTRKCDHERRRLSPRTHPQGAGERLLDRADADGAHLRPTKKACVACRFPRHPTNPKCPLQFDPVVASPSRGCASVPS